jgi:5'-nucleotidase (lipoprotein e(P4) family)
MRSNSSLAVVGVVAVLALLPGCAPSTATSQPPVAVPISTAHDTAPASLVWSRASAEHRALFLQVYRAATAQVETRAAGLTPGTWAVILDADETALDNSIYQQERARIGERYTAESFEAWARRGAATALPGVVSFTSRVRALGGRVVFVTNRAESVCPETRANLERVGVIADLVLCQPPGPSDKNPRYRAVAAGTPPSTLPPLNVIAWIGDNIQDFPALRQDVRLAADSAFSEFGRSYFLLPNPMYGSWERNTLPSP